MDHSEDTYDEAFGKAYWEKIQPYVQKVTEWTNAMMAPLPAHIVEALMDCAA